MVTWMSNWIGGIVISIIIATIIEMILPEGNNKKYIKAVIGVFVLFTILAPILSEIAKEDFDLTDRISKWEKYLKNTETKTVADHLNQTNNQTIEEIYLAKIKEDITSKIESKGYQVKDLKVEAKLDPNGEESYGKITKITAWVKRKTEEVTEEEKIEKNKEEKKIGQEIEKIDPVEIETIQVQNNIIVGKEEGIEKKEENTNTQENITIFEINDIKKQLNSTYEVPIQKIKINET